MKSVFWALGLMGASILLAWGCAGSGAFVPEFINDAPCHPTVKLELIAEASQINMTPGGHATIEIRVRDLNAPRPDQPKNGNQVALKVESKLPTGATAELYPTSVSPSYEGSYSDLMITLPSTAAPGSYDVRVVGTIGSCIRSALVRVVIQGSSSQPFDIRAEFSTATVPQRGNVQLPFRVLLRQQAAQPGRAPFSYQIIGPAEFRYTLTVTPSDIIPTLEGVPISLNLGVGSLTPTGTYNLRLQGSDGTHTDEEPFLLIVTPEEPN